MAEIIKIVNDNFQVSIWEINETIDELYNSILLSNTEKELFQTFKHDNRKLQWLAYRNALVSICGEKYSFIKYNITGKPEFENKDLLISVSHSGKYAAAIVSENYKVGIDIEIKSHKAENIKDKFLNNNELKFAKNKNDVNLYLYFWCAKEAIYKAMGFEGVIFAKDISVNNFSKNYNKAEGKMLFNSDSYFFNIEFIDNENFICAFCVLKN